MKLPLPDAGGGSGEDEAGGLVGDVVAALIAIASSVLTTFVFDFCFRAMMIK